MIILQGYEFDDVMLVPRRSSVTSRDIPDITPIGIPGLRIPIIASPMQGIVGVKLIKALAAAGGLGILHRFWKSFEERVEALKELKDSNIMYGAAFGITENVYHLLEYEPSVLVLDVANGYLTSVLRRTEEVANILKDYPEVSLISGNVVTANGAYDLYNAGADLVRVGIGSGNLCATRSVTGVGCPQLTALLDIEFNAPVTIPTISDGGIRSSGDMVKALAAGARYVMMGSQLARTSESENSGTVYGMASYKLQDDFGLPIKSIEGVEKTIEVSFSLQTLVDNYMGGLKSAMTYLNARNLYELKRNANWVTTGSNSITNYV